MTALADAYRTKYQSIADAAANQAGIPKELFSAVISKESNWNPYAVGTSGEVGLGQLMPDTAKGLGVNAWDPQQNLDGSAGLLKTLYDKFGNWRDALAGYNAGPTNLKAGYSYADAVLAGKDVIGAGGPSGMPGDTGNAQADADFNNASLTSDWIVGTVKRVGVLLLAILLLAFGVWAMIANKESGAKPV